MIRCGVFDVVGIHGWMMGRGEKDGCGNGGLVRMDAVSNAPAQREGTRPVLSVVFPRFLALFYPITFPLSSSSLQSLSRYLSRHFNYFEALLYLFVRFRALELTYIRNQGVPPTLLVAVRRQLSSEERDMLQPGKDCRSCVFRRLMGRSTSLVYHSTEALLRPTCKEVNN